MLATTLPPVTASPCTGKGNEGLGPPQGCVSWLFAMHPLQAAVLHLQPRDLQCQNCHGADNALPGHALVNRQDNMTRSAQGWEQDSQALGTGKPPLRLAASGTGHSQLTPPLPMGSHRSSSPELCRAGAALRPCCPWTAPLWGRPRGGGPAHPRPCSRRSPTAPHLAVKAAGVSHRHRPDAQEATDPAGQASRSHLAPGSFRPEEQVSGKAGNPQSRPCRARCGRTAQGPQRAPSASRARRQQRPGPAWPPPGPAPPRSRPVKGGGASYSLTAAPRRLPPVCAPVSGDRAALGLPERQQDTGAAGGSRGTGRTPLWLLP